MLLFIITTYRDKRFRPQSARWPSLVGGALPISAAGASGFEAVRLPADRTHFFGVDQIADDYFVGIRSICQNHLLWKLS
jgi:hypothetical protein